MTEPIEHHTNILKLLDEGLNQSQTAKATGYSKATVCRVAKKYGRAKANVAVKKVNDHVSKGLSALEQLKASIDKRTELNERLFELVNLGNLEGVKEAIDASIKLDAETRKTFATMSDIIWKFYMPKEIEYILNIISESLQDTQPEIYYDIIQKLEAAQQSDRYLT
jgi:hypothetical protein